MKAYIKNLSIDIKVIEPRPNVVGDATLTGDFEMFFDFSHDVAANKEHIRSVILKHVWEKLSEIEIDMPKPADQPKEI